MGLLILSKRLLKPEEIIGSIAVISLKKGLKFHLEERDKTVKNYIDLYLAKRYDQNEDEQYFYLGLENDQIEITHKNQLFYRLGITDQADYDRLMYDFSLEYLRLNPDHCISFYGETFFFLEDLEKIDADRGYFEDWCFTSLS
ncbi:hypothetical protein [Aquimarina algicola]|uniref:IPExxxVDY family protein n=1 Tax=Aquimarina algicola TaxID=2589995 RepID=A0A504JND1_9FLAO|nr:hypothetical protein [Aquimarina algicola]TPN89233.1 hypothetical protein FHK87_03125 [Aquimarina algicola]